MVKLSEISKARDDDNPDQAYELWKQWHGERGIPHEAGSHREHYMRYIETLEARLGEAEKVITDLSKGVACVLRFNGCSEEYITARLKQAHDLLAQHEREAAHGQDK